MPSIEPQNILRHDGNQRAQKIRPVCGRANQNPHADSRDVGARRVHPFTKEKLSKDQLRDDGGDNRQQSFLVTFKDSEGKLSSQRNAADQNRREITVLRAEEPHSLWSNYWRL